MPGTFVDVRVFGRTVTGLMPIPRYAVHEGNQVWVAEDGVLRIRRVEVARSDREVAYISDGLSDGDRVVVTVLDAVTDGMKIRTAGTADAEESGLDDAGNETVAYLDVGYRTLDSGSRSSRSDALGWDDGWPTLRVRHPASSIQHPASWRVGVPA
jgi:hypothetical protein